MSLPSTHLKAALEIDAQLVALALKEPGAEGTFGGTSFSHDLVHYIGGEDDTNANTTRRILLLLESQSIGQSEAYERVLQQVLKRYVEEDFGWIMGRNPGGVPRFLQNDIARYWRTVAVDFAYKRRARQAKGWALRTVKLRLSRKLTYAAGLLACYSCADRVPMQADAQLRALDLVDHLTAFLRQPPLEILAGSLVPHLHRPGIEDAARNVFESYDAFLGLLNSATQRQELEELRPDDVATSDAYEYARGLGHQFQKGLDAIFLTDNGTQYFSLTRTYGVF